MAKKSSRKLGIKRETLRRLDGPELEAVAGGTFVGWNSVFLVRGGYIGGTISCIVTACTDPTTY